MTEQSGSWRAGDLAVCIEYGPWFGAGSEATVGPDHDQVLRVALVFADVAFPRGPQLALEFDEFPDNLFPASAFRRIEPDHSAADDAEIVALIKRASVRASA
jgi:hypothetical protein